ncbi:MAG: hypothetical protein AAF995_08075 [Planctomycetota bacterium]
MSAHHRRIRGTTHAFLLASILATLGLCTLGLAGCRSAMHAPPYKRLIATFAEANALHRELEDRIREGEAAGADEAMLDEARALRDDVDAFRERMEFSLETRKRPYWHRTHMNEYWAQYVDLFPNGEATFYAFKDQRWMRIEDRWRTPLTDPLINPWDE